jgi:hypothetical protein
VGSSTHKAKSWFSQNKSKLKQFAISRNIAPAVSPRRPAVVSDQNVSDSRFLLSSLSSQMDILTSLVLSCVDSEEGALATSLASAVTQQLSIVTATITQCSEKIGRAEIYRSEIVRRNLDQEALLLRDLKRLEATAVKRGVAVDLIEAPHVDVASGEIKSWMEEIRMEIATLNRRLLGSPMQSAPPIWDGSPSSSPPPFMESPPPRVQSPRWTALADPELEELQRARERLEQQLMH